MVLKIFTFVLMALATLVLLWVGGGVLFATAAALAKPEAANTKTEALVVLTGGTGRVDEGLTLLAKEAAPKLFISGVNENVKKNDILARWKKPTNDLSDNPCCIYLGYDAKDTSGNAQEVKQWVEENNIHSIRLITSGYHMPRAYLEVSKALPQIELIRHPVHGENFSLWTKRDAVLVFSEYNKTLIQWLHLNDNQTS